MLSILIRTIKDKKTSLIIYCIAAVLIMWMYVAMFPTIQAEAESFNELIKNYPESFMKAFGIDEQISFDRVENFLSIEHFSLVWPIMMIFFMIAVATFGLATEVEKGTAEIMLSRPVSRAEIFLARYLAGLIILIIFTLVSVYSLIPLAELHDIDYALANYNTMAMMGLLFGWAVFSMAMMLSAIFSEKGRVYMIGGMTIVGMYIANVASSLLEKVENLQYISFFHYYDYQAALTKNHIDELSIYVFIGVVVVCSCIGLIWFNKRDIAV